MSSNNNRGRKSSTCFGKHNGNPVTEYDTEVGAGEGAKYALERYGNEMFPYQCPTCQLWHLSPRSSSSNKNNNNNKQNFEKSQNNKYYQNKNNNNYSRNSYSNNNNNNNSKHTYNKSRKSKTCFGKHKGNPLTEYDTEEAATSGATYALERYGNDLVPYQCSTCQLWHLSPRSSQQHHQQQQQQQNYTDAPPKSTTCFGQVSGTALTEYRTREEALQGARHAKENHDNTDLIPYICKTCTFWHLSPKDRQTPSARSDLICDCVDSTGAYKQAYGSKEDAQRRADILLEEQGTRLNVFQCDSGVWHLTSKLDFKPTSTGKKPGKKSSTCLGKRSGTFLTEYDSVDEAEEAADFAREQYDSHLSSYQCQTCQKWHLAPIGSI